MTQLCPAALSEQTRAVIRFKFMPTPSAPLHVGHAWLLFVMDTLATKAREQGHVAEVLLVIDRLMAGIQGLDEERMASNADAIVRDIDHLGIVLDAIAYNDRDPQAVDRCRRDPGFANVPSLLPAPLTPAHYFSLCSPNYFLNNAILDSVLGITHILRGADQFHNVGIYRNVYALLGLTPPSLLYLPLLLNRDQNKISSGTAFILSEVLKNMTPDELFCALVSACMARAADAPVPSNRAQAQLLLLGEDWTFVLASSGSGDPALQSAFLSRLNPQPIIDLSNE